MRPAAVVCALLLGACSSDSPAQRGRRAGGALGLSLALSIANRDAIRTPHRCGRFELSRRTGTLSFGTRTLSWSGWSGSVEGATRTLKVGAIGDARTPRSLSVARAASTLFAEEKVDVVFSLGGIAESSDTIAQTLGAVCSSDWLLIAVPGDREDLDAHREAVSRLHDEGCAIADGSHLRTLRWGDVLVATLPGASHASALLAGTRGCVHTREDATQIAGALRKHQGYRVLASYVPPRQTGTAGSDLVDGIHMGSRDLAAALADAAPNLVIHAQADRGSYETTGSQKHGKGSQIYLATGALEPLPEPAGPSTGYALTMVIGSSETRWERHPLRPGSE